jgi:hypothetical protein
MRAQSAYVDSRTDAERANEPETILTTTPPPEHPVWVEMPLAIRHEIGQVHDERGRALLRDFARGNGWEVKQGPSNFPAPIDAILTKGDQLMAVVEVRTRVTHTLADLRKMGNTYLVTHQKLLDLMEGGRLFAVPSFLIVQLACGTRYGWGIGSRQGLSLFDWEVEWTQTRATSLDARQTKRLNAYIPLSKGIVWK